MGLERGKIECGRKEREERPSLGRCGEGRVRPQAEMVEGEEFGRDGLFNICLCALQQDILEQGRCTCPTIY